MAVEQNLKIKGKQLNNMYIKFMGLVAGRKGMTIKFGAYGNKTAYENGEQPFDVIAIGSSGELQEILGDELFNELGNKLYSKLLELPEFANGKKVE